MSTSQFHHRTENAIERRAGWINVGDLSSAVHFKIVKYERIKFLVIALRDSIEIYAWAPKPYHKFMAFKSFSELQHRPLLVDLTVEEGNNKCYFLAKVLTALLFEQCYQ